MGGSPRVPSNRDSKSTLHRLVDLQRRRMGAFLEAQAQRLTELEAEMNRRVAGQRAADQAQIATLEDQLREARAQQAELENRRERGTPASAAEPAGSVLGWEAQKQRLLAALDRDFDSGQEEQAAQRLRIEEVISQTDAALAAKDRELEEMRHLLAEQSGKVGGVAVGAAALGAVLEDDLIREERANLQRLQKHWEEMVRQAEVDISIERARLARDRLEVEEKLRRYEALAGPRTSQDNAAGAEKENSASRRWFARLGLNTKDE